ncbi:MAG TPA: hypothetical protein VGN81_17215 [Pseudonocardiaceae bacterium]
MTEGPDPERLLAQALRAQAASTPVPPAGLPPGDEPGTEGGEARLVELLSGAGHGLISGREPSTVDVPYAGVPAERTGPVTTTTLDSRRPQLAWWWMLLLAIALGVACGAIAGILTLV